VAFIIYPSIKFFKSILYNNINKKNVNIFLLWNYFDIYNYKFFMNLNKKNHYNIFVFLTIFMILFFFSCKFDYKNKNFNFKDEEYLFLNRNEFNDIKINGKILIIDLTNDIKDFIKKDDSTDDILSSNNYIYDKEQLEYFNQLIDYFYDNLQLNLEPFIIEKGIENKVIFNDNTNDEALNQTTIFIEIIEYFEGEYNLIKNEKTKFKISVKLYRKDLLNSYILLFIKKYNCKPSILYPTEKLRVKEISNLCSKDILKVFKKGFK
jgi:hypothetical protein